MVRAKKGANNDPSYHTLKADYYPVQRMINLRSSATEVDYYPLDVSRCLSVVNHRLYRQGKTYSVKIDCDAGGAAKFDIFALVDTWYIQKAWQLARAAYLRATADERAVMSKQQIARWEDFRIAEGLNVAGKLLPNRYSTGLAGAADNSGEFLNSLITLADGTSTRSFTWGSATASALSVLAEFDKSGDTNSSPATISADKAYAGTDPGAYESQMDTLASNGNAPPYDAQNFNARVWVKVGTLDPTSPHGKLSTGYFNAPCGLVAVKPSVASTEITGQLSMTVQAGDYKGVKAMNMGV